MLHRLWSLVVIAPVLTGCMSFREGRMPGEPKDARFADVDGVRVHFIDTGGAESPDRTATSSDARDDAPDGAPARPTPEKPTVILVHGFASTINAWASVIPVLAKTHRVIALDLKGFGWTDRPEGDYSPDAQARLVVKLLELRGVQKAAIVAHSWGSSIALAANLAAPEKFSKIALYDAWVYEDQLPTFFHWAQAPGVGEALFQLFYKERADDKISNAFYDKRWVTERLVENVEVALDRPGTVAAALAAVRGMKYREVEHRYRTIDKPTLLLWGREDGVTPIRFGERLAHDLPNSRMIVYPRCGHFPMLEAMNASTRDLVAFLTAKDGVGKDGPP